jgi:hypothetical protein
MQLEIPRFARDDKGGDIGMTGEGIGIFCFGANVTAVA